MNCDVLQCLFNVTLFCEEMMMSVVNDLVCVSITMEGLPPGLLFQGKGLMEADAKDPTPKKKGKAYRPADEEAKLRAHWMQNGKGKQVLCIPSVMLYNSFCKAAGDYKDPGNKKRSMGTLIGSTISFDDTKISLGTDKFETYEEYVKIPPRTGAMVLVGRPLIRDWKVTFGMSCDCELWNIAILEEIIRSAGKTVGVGAWRPQLKGPYGKFRLVEFKVK
jgi:hypothetical protein